MKRIMGVLMATLALDAGTKWLASVALTGRTVSLGWLLELRLTRNDGMALGLFAGNRVAGMLLPLTVIICGWLLLRRYRLTPFTQTACGLVLGGFGVILGGALALVRSLMLFASAPMNALVNMGLSFVCIALGAVLAGIGVAIVQKLVPWVLGLIGRLVKWVSGKVGGGR